MKNIWFTSRETDWKVLKVFGVVGLSCVAGPLLAAQFEDSFLSLSFDAIVSISVALLVWSVFHLVEPKDHGRKWTIAELTVVPLVWLLLMVTLAVWFHHLWCQSDELREEMFPIVRF